MNRVQSMFSRHFSTIAGQAVEVATSCDVTEENSVQKFTEVCRAVNSYPEGAKDAVRALRKRLLGSKNVALSIALLEFCVKNLGFTFHMLIAAREFAGDVLTRLLSNQPPDEQQRILSIIRMLAEAYRNHSSMTSIVTIYRDLCSQGFHFPRVKALKTASRRHSNALVRTDDVTIIPPTQQVMLNDEQLTKLRSDIKIVSGNIRVFSEMLSEIEPSHVDDFDVRLMKDLSRTCHEMQIRITDLISQVLNEQMMMELIGINDQLNNLFLRYERFERYRLHDNRVTSLHEPPPSYAATETEDLIDFSQPMTSSSGDVIDVSSLTLEEAMTSENREEMQEVEKWLQNDGVFGQSTSAASTRDDFNVFLNERAADNSEKRDVL